MNINRANQINANGININRINAKPVNDNGWEFIQLFIDDIALDQILHAQYPHKNLLGLLPTLLPMNNHGDEPYVWQRIMPSEGRSVICPVLMCEDDIDLSCILVVADIENNGKYIRWRRLGIDQSSYGNLCTRIEWLDNIDEFCFCVNDYKAVIATYRDELLDNYIDEHYVLMQRVVNRVYAQGGIGNLFSDNIEPVPKKQSLTAHEAAAWLTLKAQCMKDTVSAHFAMQESKNRHNSSWLDKLLSRQPNAIDIFDDIILDTRNLYVAIARHSLKDECLEEHLIIAKPFWKKSKLQELQARFRHNQEQELLDYVFDSDNLAQEIL